MYVGREDTREHYIHMIVFILFCHYLQLDTIRAKSVGTYVYNVIMTKSNFLFNIYLFIFLCLFVFIYSFFTYTFILDLLGTCMWEILPSTGTRHFLLYTLINLFNCRYFWIILEYTLKVFLTQDHLVKKSKKTFD